MTGIRTSKVMSTKAGIGVRMGAGTGTRITTRMEGRQRMGTFEVVIGVGRKTREGGWRQEVTSNHKRKSRHPQRYRRLMRRNIVKGRKARNTVGEVVEEARKRKDLQKICRSNEENGEGLDRRRKT